MLPTTLLALVVVPALAPVEIKYQVISKGKKVGVLSSWTTVTPSTFAEKTTLSLTQNGQKAAISTFSESSPQGEWRKKEFSAAMGSQKIAILATPTATGARVMMDVNGKKQQRDVPRTTKTSTKDPTIGWFRYYKPKPGEKVTYQRFDAQSLVWSDVTIRYVGPKTVTVGGKPRAGFEMSREERGRKGTIVVDSKSFLIVMDTGDLRFERIYP